MQEQDQNLITAFSEFRGVVSTKLDDIKDDIRGINQTIEQRDERIGKLENRVTKLETTLKAHKWVVAAMGVGLMILSQMDWGKVLELFD